MDEPLQPPDNDYDWEPLRVSMSGTELVVVWKRVAGYW